MKPTLLHRASARVMPFLFVLVFALPTVAFGARPRAATSPNLAPDERAALEKAAGDHSLTDWQRATMRDLARGGARPEAVAGAPGAGSLARLPGAAAIARTEMDTLPPVRDNTTAIYDPVRQRMIVFGGWNGAVNLGDVWALSLTGAPHWTQLATAGTAPHARRWHTAIYDPVRDRMIVFAGFDGDLYLNDVWALTLSGTPTWSELATAGTPPSPRYRQSAIYDPVRDRMVIFGGWFSGDGYNDTWALSLSGTPTWSELVPDGTPPSRRISHTAIYDPVRDRMIVFGGIDDVLRNDVWSLSFADTLAWTELTPAGTPPLERYIHTAVYDPTRDRMLVFGGFDVAGYANDTWALSLAGSTAWTELQPGDPLPNGRQGHAAVYDSTGDRMVVFGGFGSYGFYNDAWGLSLADPVAWTPLSLPDSAALNVTATNGTVTPDPASANGHYAYGSAVLLTATPDAGYRFASWTGDASATTDTVTVLMDGDRNVTANFEPDSVTLTVTATHGTVDATPASADGRYAFGTAVLLTATPDSGHHFVDFSGDVAATSDTVTVLMDGDKSVTASFGADSVTLVVTATHGVVDATPASANGRYAFGTVVQLTAQPDTGYRFVGYTGDVVATTDTASVVMTGDKVVTASFGPDSVTLTVNAMHGSVGQSPLPTDGRYAYGTAVLLTATPDAGYHFVDFTGDATASTDTVTVVMAGDKVVTADFQPTLGVEGGNGPTVTLLMPAMPNPFRGSATMEFTVARGSDVDLSVFSVDGRHVRTLVHDHREPGDYRLAWDGRDDDGRTVSSGVYYERLVTAEAPQTRVITYLR